MCLLLVNLLLLASLEEKSTYRELDYFLKVGDKKLDVLEDNNLVDKAVGDIFTLFWESTVLLAKKVLSGFQE